MRIVAGLGNPGSAYADTRHSVGFVVVEELAQRWHLAFARPRHGARCAQGVIAGEATMLVEPHMYMNRSGEALARLEVPVTAQDLIVIHDELDLECGCVRVKRGGGTGGHHGLDSIVAQYDRDFARVRVGVGRPPRGTDAADYVLSRFEPVEREAIVAAVGRAADAVEYILREGEEAAMNRCNARSRGTLAAAALMGRK